MATAPTLGAGTGSSTPTLRQIAAQYITVPTLIKSVAMQAGLMGGVNLTAQLITGQQFDLMGFATATATGIAAGTLMVPLRAPAVWATSRVPALPARLQAFAPAVRYASAGVEEAAIMVASMPTAAMLTNGFMLHQWHLPTGEEFKAAAIQGAAMRVASEKAISFRKGRMGSVMEPDAIGITSTMVTPYAHTGPIGTTKLTPIDQPTPISQLRAGLDGTIKSGYVDKPEFKSPKLISPPAQSHGTAERFTVTTKVVQPAVESTPPTAGTPVRSAVEPAGAGGRVAPVPAEPGAAPPAKGGQQPTPASPQPGGRTGGVAAHPGEGLPEATSRSTTPVPTEPRTNGTPAPVRGEPAPPSEGRPSSPPSSARGLDNPAGHSRDTLPTAPGHGRSADQAPPSVPDAPVTEPVAPRTGDPADGVTGHDVPPATDGPAPTDGHSTRDLSQASEVAADRTPPPAGVYLSGPELADPQASRMTSVRPPAGGEVLLLHAPGRPDPFLLAAAKQMQVPAGQLLVVTHGVKGQVHISDGWIQPEVLLAAMAERGIAVPRDGFVLAICEAMADPPGARPGSSFAGRLAELSGRPVLASRDRVQIWGDGHITASLARVSDSGGVIPPDSRVATLAFVGKASPESPSGDTVIWRSAVAEEAPASPTSTAREMGGQGAARTPEQLTELGRGRLAELDPLLKKLKLSVDELVPPDRQHPLDPGWVRLAEVLTDTPGGRTHTPEESAAMLAAAADFLKSTGHEKDGVLELERLAQAYEIIRNRLDESGPIPLQPTEVQREGMVGPPRPPTYVDQLPDPLQRTLAVELAREFGLLPAHLDSAPAGLSPSWGVSLPDNTGHTQKLLELHRKATDPPASVDSFSVEAIGEVRIAEGNTGKLVDLVVSHLQPKNLGRDHVSAAEWAHIERQLRDNATELVEEIGTREAVRRLRSERGIQLDFTDAGGVAYRTTVQLHLDTANAQQLPAMTNGRPRPDSSHEALHQDRLDNDQQAVTRQVEDLHSAMHRGDPVDGSTATRLRDPMDRLGKALDESRAALDQRVEARVKKAYHSWAESLLKEEQAREALDPLQNTDRGAEQRSRGQADAAARLRDRAERDLRVADTYQRAAEQAKAAQDAYQNLRRAVDDLLAPDLPAADRAARLNELTDLIREADTSYQAYHAALKATTPHESALHTAILEGPLPFEAALVERVNAKLSDQGTTVSPKTLSEMLTAGWDRVMSQDGLVLTFGDTEILIRFHPKDVVEILNPPIETSTTGSTKTPQRNATAIATGNQRGIGSSSVPFSGRSLAGLIPEFGRETMTAIKEFVSHVNFRGSFGKNRSVLLQSSGFGHTTRGTTLTNVGGDTLVDATGVWEVGVRAAPAKGRSDHSWHDVELVDSVQPGDRDSMRLWVAHPYTERAPDNLVRIDFGKRTEQIPDHDASGLTGLNELTDQTIALLKPRFGNLDSVTRKQLRAFITAELPANLRTAINEPNGFQALVTHNGETHALVQIRTRVKQTEGHSAWDAEPVGTASRWHRLGKVETSTVNAAGSVKEVHTTSHGLDATRKKFGIPSIRNVFDFVFGEGTGNRAESIENNGDAGLGYSRNPGRDNKLSAGHSAIRSAEDQPGHTQGYRIELVHEVSVQMIGPHLTSVVRPRVGSPVEGSALLRMSEVDAYQFGLPVDAAAVRLDRDGQVRLRDDLTPGPPPGRLDKPPSWLGPDGIPGIGPGKVDKLTWAPEKNLRAELEALLRNEGLLPRVHNGTSVFARNPITASHQIANLRAVEALFGADLAGRYNQATQDGIPLVLHKHRPGQVPEQVTFRVRLEPDHGRAQLEGYRTTTTMSNAEISVNPLKQTAGESVGHSLRGKRNYKTADATDLFKGSGAKDGGKHARTHGSSSSIGKTVIENANAESVGPTAVFEVPHRVVVERVTVEHVTEVLDAPGSARLLLPAELLPRTGAAEFPSSPWQGFVVTHADGSTAPGTTWRALQEARPFHLDARLWEVVENVLPVASKPGSAGYVHLRSLLDIQNLISHREWLFAKYGTEFVVEPRGITPLYSELSISARAGVSHFEGAIPWSTGSTAAATHSYDTTTTRGRSTVVDGGSGVKGVTEDGTNWSAGGNIAKTRGYNETHSSSQTGSRSRNVLDEGGYSYIYRVPVEFRLDGIEYHLPSPEARTRLATRDLVYTLPERVALELYAAGEHPVPLDQVADALTRYANGHLNLSRNLVVDLLVRYRHDIAGHADLARQYGLPDGSFHRSDGLADKLGERLAGQFPDAEVPPEYATGSRRIDYLLRVSARRPPVADFMMLPDYLQQGFGNTGLEFLNLADSTGRPIDLVKQTMQLIEAVSPELVAKTPGLEQGLFGLLAGQRWRGLIDTMTLPDGLQLSFKVGPSERVTVQLSVTRDTATPIGRLDDTNIIVNDMSATSNEVSRSPSGSSGANSNNSNRGGADWAHQPTSGTGADRGRGSSDSYLEKDTQQSRYAAFNGVDAFDVGFRMRVEVVREQLPGTGLVGKAADAGTRALREHVSPRPADAPSRASAEFNGSVRMLVPDGTAATRAFRASDQMAKAVATAVDREAVTAAVTAAARARAEGAAPEAVATAAVMADANARAARAAARAVVRAGVEFAPEVVNGHGAESQPPVPFDALPERFQVELADRAALQQTIRELLARKGMLDQAKMTIRDPELRAILDLPPATISKLFGPDGHQIASLTEPGSPNGRFNITIKAVPKTVQVISEGQPGVQLGKTIRSDRLHGESARNDLFQPFNPSYSGEAAALAGMDGRVAAEFDSTYGRSSKAGIRSATSSTARGSATKLRVEIEYQVTVEKFAKDGGKLKDSQSLSSTGEAILIVHDQAVAEMRARAAAPKSPEPPKPPDPPRPSDPPYPPKPAYPPRPTEPPANSAGSSPPHGTRTFHHVTDPTVTVTMQRADGTGPQVVTTRPHDFSAVVSLAEGGPYADPAPHLGMDGLRPEGTPLSPIADPLPYRQVKTGGIYFPAATDHVGSLQSAQAMPRFPNTFTVVGHYDAAADAMLVDGRHLSPKQFAEELAANPDFMEVVKGTPARDGAVVALVAGGAGDATVSPTGRAYTSRLAEELQSHLDGRSIRVLGAADSIVHADAGANTRPDHVYAARVHPKEAGPPQEASMQAGRWSVHTADGVSGVREQHMPNPDLVGTLQRLFDYHYEPAPLPSGVRTPVDGHIWAPTNPPSSGHPTAAGGPTWSAAELGSYAEVVVNGSGRQVVWVRSHGDAADPALRNAVFQAMVPPGQVAIVARGSGGRAFVDGGWIEPAPLAELLANRGYAPDAGHTLLISEALSGGDSSLARQFQRVVGGPVRATEHPIWISSDGPIITAVRVTGQGHPQPLISRVGPDHAFVEITSSGDSPVPAPPAQDLGTDPGKQQYMSMGGEEPAAGTPAAGPDATPGRETLREVSHPEEIRRGRTPFGGPLGIKGSTLSGGFMPRPDPVRVLEQSMAAARGELLQRVLPGADVISASEKMLVIEHAGRTAEIEVAVADLGREADTPPAISNVRLRTEARDPLEIYDDGVGPQAVEANVVIASRLPLGHVPEVVVERIADVFQRATERSDLADQQGPAWARRNDLADRYGINWVEDAYAADGHLPSTNHLTARLGFAADRLARSGFSPFVVEVGRSISDGAVLPELVALHHAGRVLAEQGLLPTDGPLTDAARMRTENAIHADPRIEYLLSAFSDPTTVYGPGWRTNAIHRIVELVGQPRTETSTDVLLTLVDLAHTVAREPALSTGSRIALVRDITGWAGSFAEHAPVETAQRLSHMVNRLHELVPEADARSHWGYPTTARTPEPPRPTNPADLVVDRPPFPRRRSGPAYVWQSISDFPQAMQLFDGPPQRHQATQTRNLGNCGYVATLGSLAAHMPEAIRQAVRPGPDGGYVVRIFEPVYDFRSGIWRPGREFEVNVSGELPVLATDPSRPAFISDGVGNAVWAPVLEKAIAGAESIFDRASSEKRGLHGYHRLDVGSDIRDRAAILTMLTGRQARDHLMPIDPADLAAQLNAVLADGRPLLVGSRGTYDGIPLPYDVVAGHAYEVVRPTDQGFLLRNPWGEHHVVLTAEQIREVMGSHYTTLVEAPATSESQQFMQMGGEATPAADGPVRPGTDPTMSAEASRELFDQRITDDLRVRPAATDRPTAVIALSHTSIDRPALDTLARDRFGDADPATVVNTDRLLSHHPAYAEIASREGRAGAANRLTTDGDRWLQMADDLIIGRNANTVRHVSVADPEQALAVIERYRQAGYQIDVVAVSVPEAVHRLDALRQSLDAARRGQHEFVTEPHSGDGLWDVLDLLDYSQRAEPNGVDSIRVHTSDGAEAFHNERAADGTWNSQSTAAETLGTHEQGHWTPQEQQSFKDEVVRLAEEVRDLPAALSELAAIVRSPDIPIEQATGSRPGGAGGTPFGGFMPRPDPVRVLETAVAAGRDGILQRLLPGAEVTVESGSVLVIRHGDRIARIEFFSGDFGRDATAPAATSKALTDHPEGSDFAAHVVVSSRLPLGRVSEVVAEQVADLFRQDAEWGRHLDQDGQPVGTLHARERSPLSPADRTLAARLGLAVDRLSDAGGFNPFVPATGRPAAEPGTALTTITAIHDAGRVLADAGLLAADPYHATVRRLQLEDAGATEHVRTLLDIFTNPEATYGDTWTSAVIHRARELLTAPRPETALDTLLQLADLTHTALRHHGLPQGTRTPLVEDLNGWIRSFTEHAPAESTRQLNEAVSQLHEATPETTGSVHTDTPRTPGPPEPAPGPTYRAAERPAMPEKLAEQVTYAHVNEIPEAIHLFLGKEPPSHFQVFQGALGDCGTVVVLGTAATHLPDVINSAIRPLPNKQGFLVRLHEPVPDFQPSDARLAWLPGREFHVEVTPELPVLVENNQKLAFTHDEGHDTYWAALLEKAVTGADIFFDRAVPDQHGYNRLEGLDVGKLAGVLTMLTGRPAELGWLTRSGDALEAESTIRRLLDDGQPVLIGVPKTADGSPLPYRVVAEHAYEIMEYRENGTFFLRNAWGIKHAYLTAEQILEVGVKYYVSFAEAPTAPESQQFMQMGGDATPAADGPVRQGPDPTMSAETGREFFEQRIADHLKVEPATDRPTAVIALSHTSIDRLGLEALARERFADTDPATVINTDRLLRHHPAYAEIASREGRAGAANRLTTDGNRWLEMADDLIIGKNANTVRHVSVTDPEQALAVIGRYRQAGYQIDIVAVSVPEAVHQLETLRQSLDAADRGRPSPVAEPHAGDGLRLVLDMLDAAAPTAPHAVDSIRIHGTDGTQLYHNQRLPDGVWESQPSAMHSLGAHERGAWSQSEQQSFKDEVLHLADRAAGSPDALGELATIVRTPELPADSSGTTSRAVVPEDTSNGGLMPYPDPVAVLEAATATARDGHLQQALPGAEVTVGPYDVLVVRYGDRAAEVKLYAADLGSDAATPRATSRFEANIPAGMAFSSRLVLSSRLPLGHVPETVVARIADLVREDAELKARWTSTGDPRTASPERLHESPFPADRALAVRLGFAEQRLNDPNGFSPFAPGTTRPTTEPGSVLPTLAAIQHAGRTLADAGLLTADPYQTTVRRLQLEDLDAGAAVRELLSVFTTPEARYGDTWATEVIHRAKELLAGPRPETAAEALLELADLAHTALRQPQLSPEARTALLDDVTGLLRSFIEHTPPEATRRLHDAITELHRTANETNTPVTSHDTSTARGLALPEPAPGPTFHTKRPKLPSESHEGSATYRPIKVLSKVGELFDGPPNHHQVTQGRLGDCGSIAVVGAVAHRLPDVINNAIQRQENGSSYLVHLHEPVLAPTPSGSGEAWLPGRRFTVEVTPELPVRARLSKSLIYASDPSGATHWAAILEKALAGADIFFGRPDNTNQQGYGRLVALSYEHRTAVLTMLTGRAATLDLLPASAPEVAATLRRLVDENRPTVIGIPPARNGGPLPYGVVGLHAYEVVGYRADGTFQLRNPWGQQHVSLTAQQLLEVGVRRYTSLVEAPPAAQPQQFMQMGGDPVNTADPVNAADPVNDADPVNAADPGLRASDDSARRQTPAPVTPVTTLPAPAISAIRQALQPNEDYD
ncbi:hypothetical protein GCM10027290_62210 [Micromonospora sonneratiae]